MNAKTITLITFFTLLTNSYCNNSKTNEVKLNQRTYEVVFTSRGKYYYDNLFKDYQKN